ncbi:TOM1-like protein 2 isoform X1 [Eupeodes corollae]|uniref:TOM1-like protein 2 isoform X1 n=1 Tax=Eupeodes corollae TaxID=290404 RepID=UPI0024903F97|nr:TOM1-like protein 2 isoform X1 [Eupeodes corollae]
MASFFNVGGLGGNPFSTPVGQRIEQATDAVLASENWALNMEICDMINESSDTARDAMKAIRRRLTQNAGKNYQVIIFTLTVLETCVKNCGKAFHVLVAQKEFIQELVKLIGPKNDPPAIVQEKVLSLIQIWADAFKNQPELIGVNLVYQELKNKGIEFPNTDLDAMAPIYTPQRSVPEPPPVSHQHQPTSPQHVGAPQPGVTLSGPTVLTPEQTTKLQSELEVVGFSMSILGEMLNELKPGEEDPEDYKLFTDLTHTCKEMQGRVVELIGRISNDEITAELLRLNDELNNLFLRHQRYEKNRAPNGTGTTSPSAILGAAIGVPSPSAAKDPAKESLIDLSDTASGTDLLGTEFSKLDVGSGSTQKVNDVPPPVGIKASAVPPPADEFDMLAQSRKQSSEIISKTGILKDIPSVDATTGSVGSPLKKPPMEGVSKLPPKESEFDEMEAWLSNSKENEGPEETLTSTEFDKFLAERAAAAESLPSVASPGSDDSSNNSRKKKSSKKEDENLLAL